MIFSLFDGTVVQIDFDSMAREVLRRVHAQEAALVEFRNAMMFNPAEVCRAYFFDNKMGGLANAKN